MYLSAIVLVLLLKCCYGVIYKMNQSEYNRMPPLYLMDDFDLCLLEPGGTYCLVDIDLHGDNSLMNTIREYSAHTYKHYNHTQIHRGVCVTSSCKNFLHENYTEQDLNNVLEACQNQSLYNQYEIEGKLTTIRYCKRQSDRVVLDTGDIVVCVVYFVLIMLNVGGSLYDILFIQKDDKKGNRFLLTFSMQRNWSRLVAPIGTSDPRLERLKLFNGLRSMTMVCVLFSHTVLLMSYSYLANPHFIEEAYYDLSKQILYNGSLVTYTFFVMSAFLLAYNIQLQKEKNSLSWWHWPKGMLMRWLRITPSYALMLATISTIMRYLGNGPLWDLVVSSESQACRKYWWAHILYINNYVYDDYACAPQTWYLAADTQLFGFGLFICLLARRPRAQVIWLVGIFMASLLITAAHTYFQDLDATVIQSPESCRSIYATNNTFRLVYIRGHTNISTYSLGLAGGFLAYYWQKQKKNLLKYKNVRWLYWVAFPIAVAVILSGGVFYIDGYQPPIAVKVIYATLYKPIFQALVVFFIVCTIFKIETLYRGIVEWRGFTWMGRTTYCAFLVHTIFQRGFMGMMRSPFHINDYAVMMILAGSVVLTYVGAVLLWLTVESPVGGIIKLVMGGQKPKEEPEKPEIKETADNTREIERSKV